MQVINAVLQPEFNVSSITHKSKIIHRPPLTNLEPLRRGSFVKMPQTSNKRNSDELSPPMNEPNKKYLFTPENLISKNKYLLTNDQIEKASSLIYQGKHAAAISDMDTNTTEINENQSPEPNVKKIKIPPIYLHNADKLRYQEILADLKENAKSEFTTVHKNNQLRINVTSIEDYRAMTKHFSDNNLSYHTFKDPENNNLSVIIRNVPVSLTETEIKEELDDLKYPIIKVARLYNRSRHPIPLCAVDLSNTQEGKQILSLEKLNYSIVEVELRRKSKEIPQCKRCQLYGHTRNYCQSQPRCVKCTGHHLYNNCPKKPGEDPQCCNCLEKHPANHKGCSYYKQITQNQTRNNSYRIQNRTYSQAALRLHLHQQNTPQRNTQPSTNPLDYTDLITTILQKLVELLIPHLDKLTPLLTTILPSLLNNGSK